MKTDDERKEEAMGLLSMAHSNPKEHVRERIEKERERIENETREAHARVEAYLEPEIPVHTHKRRLKILFADDQIPDDSISDDDVKTVIKNENPQWPEKFIDAFSILRQAVKTLRLAGYDVTIARTLKDALNLVKDTHFDLAIVDLGWFADEGLPDAKRESAGWDICDAIEKADRKLRTKSQTLQIIYSAHFQDDPSISIHAADKGKLPLFKIYGEAGHQALKAAVKFIESHLTSPSVREQLAYDLVADYKQMMAEYLKEPLKQQKLWFMLTVVFVGLSISLLLVGAISVVFWDMQVGTLTSISSILTTVISSLLYVQLRRTQKIVEKSHEKIESLFKSAVERFYSSLSQKRKAKL